MSMEARYCPYCGADHHAAEREADETERAAIDREVEIERLRTKRDIEVARINAGAASEIAASEAEHDVAHAEGVVAGVDATMEAVHGAPDNDAAPEPEPVDNDDEVVVVPPDMDDDEPDAPPKADEHDEHHEREPRRKAARHGFF